VIQLQGKIEGKHIRPEPKKRYIYKSNEQKLLDRRLAVLKKQYPNKSESELLKLVRSVQWN